MGHARVLVVDDEPDITTAVAEGLRATLPVEVTTASSAEEAWDLIERGVRFDVVITDFRMSGADGAALLARVAAREPSVCRVMMSAYPEGSVGASLVDAHLFLPKPLRLQELAERLDRVCLRRSLGRDERAAFR